MNLECWFLLIIVIGWCVCVYILVKLVIPPSNRAVIRTLQENSIIFLKFMNHFDSKIRLIGIFQLRDQISNFKIWGTKLIGLQKKLKVDRLTILITTMLVTHFYLVENKLKLFIFCGQNQEILAIILL